MTATGSYSDSSTADITNTVSWTVSDTSIVTINGATGQLTMQLAGEIWGADVGVTATLAPGTPGTGTLVVIASDSGSVAPRMPNQNSHWQALGISPWGSWWGFQEASGSDTLVGSGSAAFNISRLDGTAGDGIGIRQGGTLPDWSRVGATLSGNTAQRISAAAAVGPNPSTHSVAWLAYVRIDSNGQSPASGRLLGMAPAGAANQSGLTVINLVGTNGMLRTLSQLGSKQLVGPSVEHADRVHPILYIYNRTTAECWAFTDSAVAYSASHAALADDIKGFGARAATVPASASFVWAAMATGSVIERLCDPSASADFLSRLGWDVQWKTCPIDSGTIKLPFLDMHWKELGLQTWMATWNFTEGVSSAQSFDHYQGVQAEGWALAVGGTGHTYENAVPHWKRKALGMTGGASQRVSRACSNMVQWDSTGSMAIIAYISGGVTTTANRQFFGHVASNAQARTLAVTNGALNNLTPVIYCAGATATGSQQIMNDRVHPVLAVYDKTNSRVKLYTDLEKITGSFNALTHVNSITSSIAFGGIGEFNNACRELFLWGAFTTGTLAESLSDDGVASDFLKRLGWTVSW